MRIRFHFSTIGPIVPDPRYVEWMPLHRSEISGRLQACEIYQCLSYLFPSNSIGTDYAQNITDPGLNIAHLFRMIYTESKPGLYSQT